MSFDDDSAIDRIFGLKQPAIFFFNEENDHPFNPTFFAIASAEKRMSNSIEKSK